MRKRALLRGGGQRHQGHFLPHCVSIASTLSNVLSPPPQLECTVDISCRYEKIKHINSKHIIKVLVNMNTDDIPRY